MPPVKKVQKEDIVTITYEIVRKEGMQVVNARKIAKELQCSVQPIYHNFADMEGLKEAVMEKIRCTYFQYMRKGATAQRAYLGMGVAYIQFAREYPNFFKLLFMSESNLSPDDYLTGDVAKQDILHNGQIFSGLSGEQQKKFHLKVWVFTHGLATLTASGTVNFTDEEITELLGSTTRELLAGFKKHHKQEGV